MKAARLRKTLAMAMVLILVLSLLPAMALAAYGGEVTLTAGDRTGSYEWRLVESESLGDYYELTNVVYCGEPVAPDYQSLHIYVPAGYMDGETINGYTAGTAPVIMANSAAGWAGKTPSAIDGFGKSLELDWAGILEHGYVLVSIGTRGPATKNDDGTYNGKAPENVADAKAAVRFLKANDSALPGDMQRIISVGTSGGGGMSTIVGASGNAEEYLPYLYEMGTCGVSMRGGRYIDEGDDSVFAMQCYAPITDLDNADLGYNWFYGPDSNNRGTVYTFNEFERAVTGDMAKAYESYVLGLDIGYTDIDDYADDLAGMFESSLNAYLAQLGTDAREAYLEQNEQWISYDEDAETASIAGDDDFGKIESIAQNHNRRSKGVLGFDNLTPGSDSRAENQLFGLTGTEINRLHFSEKVAGIMLENREKYASLDGFEAAQAAYEENEGVSGYDDFITAYETALTPEMKTRVYAMNPMNYIAEYRDGGSVQPARYFRISYGSTDSNTTPTVVFNLGKMLESAGINAEYGLYWGGGHGNFTSKPDETAAFFEWIETSVAEARLADGPVTETVDPAIYLDYSAGIEAGVYSWFESDDGSFWYLVSCDENGEPRHATEGMGAASKYIGAYTSSKITNPSFQGIAVCVPTEYLRFDGGEVCGINYFGTKGGYSALSAPIIYENSNGGWNSGACKISDAAKYIAEGMVYVGAGSRSRDAKDASGMFITGKAPTQVVDLKAGVIALRANSDIIPGNKDLIFSVGASGAGQMSSILGASGDMPEYYEYLYETGAIGVSKTARGYVSRYSDAVCGAQCYCPISDLENADLAYAWMRYDSTFDENGSFTAVSGGKLSTEFDIRLQELEAWAFVDYINSLGLRDARGRSLTLVTPREGSYYDAVLGAMSDALNAWAENTEFPVSVTTGRGESAVTTIYNSAEEYLGRYDNESGWLVKNADGSYSVTDMAGFIIGTGLVRNKTVPGFDTMPNSAENTAFGTSDMAAAHYSSTVAAVLKENYDELSTLEGFNKAQVDLYIEQALDGEIAELTGYQADLMNATEILLGNNGLSAVSPARFWRTRNGTADQHTSFTIAFNMCAAANAARLDADYSLVWDMGHGSAEGTTTGTFIQWVKDCAKNAYKPSDRPSGGSGSSSGGTASRPEQPTTPTEPETPDIPETVRLPFADVKAGDWFYDDVAYVYEQGMMTGVSGSMFAPGSNTTRGMIVTILYRLEGEPAVSGGSGFADVPSGSYYEKAIAWAAENGIVSGFDAVRFGPDENITREQLAAILYRYAAFKGIGTSGAESLDGFADAGSVSAYALEAMRWAVGNGIVTGTGTALAPAGTASRSQAAAMLHRFCVLTA